MKLQTVIIIAFIVFVLWLLLRKPRVATNIIEPVEDKGAAG